MRKIDLLKNHHKTIPEYYEHLGCKEIGIDEFKSHPVTVMDVGL